MSIKQSRFTTTHTHIHRTAMRLSVLALLAISSTFAATAAMAASNTSDANARYQAERAMCNSGQSYQDRATCLREAGAALQESKKRRLGNDQGANDAYKHNALIRCNALPADDREACQRRIEGEGTISGSVPEGGVLRELVVPDNK